MTVVTSLIIAVGAYLASMAAGGCVTAWTGNEKIGNGVKYSLNVAFFVGTALLILYPPAAAPVAAAKATAAAATAAPKFLANIMNTLNIGVNKAGDAVAGAVVSAITKLPIWTVLGEIASLWGGVIKVVAVVTFATGFSKLVSVAGNKALEAAKSLFLGVKEKVKAHSLEEKEEMKKLEELIKKGEGLLFKPLNDTKENGKKESNKEENGENGKENFLEECYQVLNSILGTLDKVTDQKLQKECGELCKRLVQKCKEFYKNETKKRELEYIEICSKSIMEKVEDTVKNGSKEKESTLMQKLLKVFKKDKDETKRDEDKKIEEDSPSSDVPTTGDGSLESSSHSASEASA